MKKISSLFVLVALFLASLSAGWAAQPAGKTTAKPVTRPAAKPQTPVTPAAYIDPMLLLLHYMLPKGSQNTVGSWDVGAPSPIKWATPGIVMSPNDNDLYSFSRQGKIPDWNITQFGPRAGVLKIQMQSSKPYEAKLGLHYFHIPYKLLGCNEAGSLVLLIPPDKDPGILYIKGQQELDLWPSHTLSEAKDLATSGIVLNQLKPAQLCQF